MVNAAIVGITGYTGEELLKILLKHKNVKVSVIAGRAASETKPLKEIYPHLKEAAGLTCIPFDAKTVAGKADVVFLARPHRVSFEIVPELLNSGKKVIDLSADFRLNDGAIYEKWYGVKHTAGQTLAKAVYGLPEVYRKEIKNAALIANPGCYPTTAILGLLPAIKNGLIDISSIIIDSKSGVSGAGRKPTQEFFAKEPLNFRPYNIAGAHRHIPEMEQELSKASGKKITLTFTPHLIPVERGMLSTIYASPAKKTTTAEVQKVYEEFYKDEPFVRVLPEGKMPGIKNVVNSNFCEISIKLDERTNRFIIVSAIDNLVKGASGVAVQNMNIMFGFDEKDGLI
jgi:N-acetyl-gamma-glutamyl-phosphate reductase